MASNAIIQCSSSSSHKEKIYKYDVFVSFRGEDTRNNFTGFLFQALHRKSIEAFKDNEDLKKGESIGPELLQAIQESHIFVVVFSKNYASSTWCLRELVEICNYIESTKHVLPIFYDVDPSEVRKQTESYEKAFAKHEEKFREDKEKIEEVQRWREALTQVGNISGWDIRNKPQYIMIDEIVQKISNILGPKYSSLPNDHLVGMDSRVEELAKLLHLGSVNDVRVVGISGMGGIGKTTLARALYESISHQYDSHCFIDDVSKIFRESGALGLQKQLLCQSLNETNLQINNVTQGTCSVWTKLRHERALIVLDNVDHNEQLNMFTGNRETLLRECLCGGSRIIIISRDKKILWTHVDELYLVQPLAEEEESQLFCINAFQINYIMSGYENLIREVLSYVQGHPLAIKVLGKSLFGENVSQWKSVLVRLREDPNKDIMNVLRVGFDDLGYMDKQIFLDMACFFSGDHEQYVRKILDIRGFHPEVGLGVLANKSLITIGKMIHMPNLLRDLGKYIVQEKSPKDPSKWSRLWDYQDLQRVMLDNVVAKNLEAIVINFNPLVFRETIIRVDALSKMRNLKLLILANLIKTAGNLNDLSSELGYLHYANYPCHCLPQSFQPHKLVELSLHESNIKQLWEDTKPLHNLRRLDLSYSEKLIKMQNFGEALNLESINLQGCIRLEEIDPSFGFPRSLTTLNLTDCRSLIMLPHFREALNLEILNLQGCKKLKLIDPSIGFLKNLTVLNLEDCKSLLSLPSSILELNSLEYLTLFGCSQLYKNNSLEEPRDAEHSKMLCTREAPSHSQSPSSFFRRFITWLLPLHSREQKDSVNWLLPSLSIFSCMRYLDLSFCNLLHVPDAIGNLHWLERPCLRGNNFAVMPSLKELSNLLHLNLQNCKRLVKLPELPSQTDVTSQNYNLLSQIRNHFYWLNHDEYGSGLNIFNCPELAKREHCSNMCFPWIMQIVKAHHQYTPYIYDRMLWPPRISSIISGSEIPRWFNSEHVCTDNVIRIDVSGVMHDVDWIGVACSAIFVVRNQRATDPPKTKPGLPFCIPLLIRKDLVTEESDHLWLFCFNPTTPNFFCNPDSIKCSKQFGVKISDGEGYVVEVKKYGYRFLYKQDLQLSNLTMMHTQTSLPQKRKFSAIEENQ